MQIRVDYISEKKKKKILILFSNTSMIKKDT